MKNSKFVIDNFAKLLEKGLITSKDLTNELININHNSISEKNELTSTESQEVNEDPRRKRRRSSASS